MRRTRSVDFLDVYVEDLIRERGGEYVAGEPFQPFAVPSDDGRLVTGQQQFSGDVFGEQLVATLRARRSASEAPVA